MTKTYTETELKEILSDYPAHPATDSVRYMPLFLLCKSWEDQKKYMSHYGIYDDPKDHLVGYSFSP